MSGDPRHDLDWQAFLYVTGEMSGVEAEVFEEQLAEDQAAREAVARAVELLAKLAAEANSVTERAIASGHSTRRRTIFAAMATAAALVLVCFSLARRQPFGFDAEPIGKLVSLWIDSDELAEDWPDADLSSVPAPNEADDHGEPGDHWEAVGLGEADDLAVPGWMLAAVESPADDKSDNKLEEN